MPPFVIAPTERVTLVGRTGSGKTYAARSLLAKRHRLIVIDPKDELLEPAWNLEDYTDRLARDLLAGKPARIRVTAPVGELPDWEVSYRLAYMAAGPTQPVAVYTDEVYGVVNPGSKPGPWFTAVYTRGRTRYCSAWAATQRPTWVPRFLFSEADWLLCFLLSELQDRKRMAEVMGPLVEMAPPTRYGFWLKNVYWKAPILAKQIKVVKATRQMVKASDAAREAVG